MREIIIPCMFASMNVWIEKNRIRRGAWSAGNEMKQRDQKIVTGHIEKQIHAPLIEPVFIEFKYYCPDGRRDPDNICGYFHKIFLDALVQSGRLKNDGFRNVYGFCDSFFLDKKNIRIEIIIHENMR